MTDAELTAVEANARASLPSHWAAHVVQLVAEIRRLREIVGFREDPEAIIRGRSGAGLW